jgi:hypothetical protein
MPWDDPRPHSSGINSLRRALKSPHARDLRLISGATAVFGGVLAWRCFAVDSSLAVAVVGGMGATIAWAYQSANTRFGVVDLFAAEILTICRVSAALAFMPNCVALFRCGKTPPHMGAGSQEDYMVAFDSNSKELEVLDGRVVVPVTQFYVYFKSLRDSMSRMDAMTRQPPADTGSNNPDPTLEALLNMIYMAFLTFESARFAARNLLDGTRSRQEGVLLALLSEIPAYLLLKEVFDKRPGDIRKKKIDHRFPGYQELMRELKGERAFDSELRIFAGEITAIWDQSCA